MKAQYFQQNNGGTDACMDTITKATKKGAVNCYQMTHSLLIAGSEE